MKFLKKYFFETYKSFYNFINILLSFIYNLFLIILKLGESIFINFNF